jgi:hypothetical protein
MVDLKLLVDLVQKEFNIADLSTKKRGHERVHARWVYFKLARMYTHKSFSLIGKEVKRDHATVLHGLKYIDTDMKDRRFHYVRDIYDKIEKFLITGDQILRDENLVDLQSLLNRIKVLEKRVNLLEYEKQNKQDQMGQDKNEMADAAS